MCGTNCPPCWIKHDTDTWACYVYATKEKCPEWKGMFDKNSKCNKPEPNPEPEPEPEPESGLRDCPNMEKNSCLNHGESNNVCKGGFGCPPCWIHHIDKKNWACYNKDNQDNCPWPNFMIDTSKEGGKCNLKPPKSLPKCPSLNKDSCLNHGESNNVCKNGLKCPPCWIHHTDNKNWACYNKINGGCPWPDYMVDTSKKNQCTDPNPDPNPDPKPEPKPQCPRPLDDTCLNHGDLNIDCKDGYKCPPCWIRHTDGKNWACYNKDKLGNCPWPKHMIDISKESEQCPEICPE